MPRSASPVAPGASDISSLTSSPLSSPPSVILTPGRTPPPATTATADKTDDLAAKVADLLKRFPTPKDKGKGKGKGKAKAKPSPRVSPSPPNDEDVPVQLRDWSLDENGEIFDEVHWITGATLVYGIEPYPGVTEELVAQGLELVAPIEDVRERRNRSWLLEDSAKQTYLAANPEGFKFAPWGDYPNGEERRPLIPKEGFAWEKKLRVKKEKKKDETEVIPGSDEEPESEDEDFVPGEESGESEDSDANNDDDPDEGPSGEAGASKPKKKKTRKVLVSEMAKRWPKFGVMPGPKRKRAGDDEGVEGEEGAPARKLRRAKPGKRAEREITYYQKRFGLFFSKRKFAGLLREINHDICSTFIRPRGGPATAIPDKRFTPDAVLTLQECAEDHIARLFSDANAAAEFRSKKTVGIKDFQFVKKTRGGTYGVSGVDARPVGADRPIA